MFVPAFLAWTAAPTSAAPELSVAVPEIVAVSTCAARRFTPTTRKRNTLRTHTETYLKYFAKFNMNIPPTRNRPPPDPNSLRSKYYKTYTGVKRCQTALHGRRYAQLANGGGLVALTGIEPVFQP